MAKKIGLFVSAAIGISVLNRAGSGITTRYRKGSNSDMPRGV
jgi:hypothetical protein